MNRYLFLAIITAVSAALQIPQLQAVTIWNANLIQHGEWWRILSGNFTHTNLIHLVMNMAALWIMAYLFRPTANNLLIVLVSGSAFVGTCLLSSDMTTYAGLSGVLHSIFAFYSLTEAINGRRSSWLLVIGVIAKIGYEQWFGASASTAALINARVAIEAHLAGGIFGLLAAYMLHIKKAFLSQKRPL